eukprot:gene3670-16907_t
MWRCRQQLWAARDDDDQDTMALIRTANALLELSTQDAVEGFCVTYLYSASLYAPRCPGTWDVPN